VAGIVIVDPPDGVHPTSSECGRDSHGGRALDAPGRGTHMTRYGLGLPCRDGAPEIQIMIRPRTTTLVACLVLAACSDAGATGTIEVLERLAHDAGAYTQGLELHDGVLYESTGKYGESDVRTVDPSTGEVLSRWELGPDHFGEGLTRVGERMLQLTWRERIVLSYPMALAAPDTLDFPSDGWGACFDGSTLWTTSGGSLVTGRDPQSLETTRQFQVMRGGSVVREVNELECVGDHIYANVYLTNDLLKIDKETGEALVTWDLTSLVPPEFLGAAEEVPNGIAYDAATDSFYITGKWWPVMYRVRLVE